MWLNINHFFKGGIMKYKLSEILSLSLDVGEAMIKSGAEISRVEDTVRRICEGYNVKYIEVYAINTLLIATLRNDKESVTESRRVTYSNNNFYELERVNELSRNIVVNNVSRKEVLKRINKIKVDKNMYLMCFGQMIAAGSFTIFFGGKVLDLVFSAIIAFILFLLVFKSLTYFLNILAKGS